MKKNNYSLDKKFLSIKTECGEYRFKVDGDTGLANAERIADVMVNEMEKVEKQFQTAREQSNPYAKLLLSNLNISERYIQLENKYNLLLQQHEEMKALYQRQDKSGDAYKQRLKNNKSFPKTKTSDELPPSQGKKDVETKKEAFPEAQQAKEPGGPLPEEIRKEASIPPPQPAIKPRPETPVKPPVERPIKPLEQEHVKPTVQPQPEPPVKTSMETLEKPGPSTKTPEQPPVKTEAPIKPLAQEHVKPAVQPQPELPVKPSMETLEKPPTKTGVPIKDQDQAEPAVQSQPGPLVKQILETLKKPQPPVKPPMETLEKPLEEAQPEPQPQPQPQPEPEPEPQEEPQEEPQPEPLEEPSSQLRINTPGRNLTNSIAPGNNYSDEFQLPSLDFLKSADREIEVDHEAIRRDAELLEQKLGYFGIKGEVMEVSPGPVITTFEYKPAPGIKISKIVNLADDLALALSALSIRIVAPIPGKDVIGVEIPNAKMSIVPFIDIVGSDDFINNESHTPVCLGKDIIGNPVVVGLDKMPHLLIAGATGTGKSVGLNAMIASILYKSSPDRVKFIMIDPKRIELSLFNDIPHLITPVITDMKKANTALQWVVREMEHRYEMLAKLQVRNIEQYNQKIKNSDVSEYDEDECFEEFSYIVIIIDELADLMMTASKDIEFSLTRIAQMARAAGIHLILATQRPSVDVLTGIIKANFPTRISFQVSSKTDSRTIIDSNGAETLLGRGDMLFVPPGTARLTRVHGTYLSEEELITITDFIKAQGKPRYLLDVTTEKEEEPTVEVSDDDYDEKYQAALEYVLTTRQASISSVQRALRVGYNRAARIIDLMEKKGIVGPSDGVKPRQVLIDRMV